MPPRAAVLSTSRRLDSRAPSGSVQKGCAAVQEAEAAAASWPLAVARSGRRLPRRTLASMISTMRTAPRWTTDTDCSHNRRAPQKVRARRARLLGRLHKFESRASRPRARARRSPARAQQLPPQPALRVWARRALRGRVEAAGLAARGSRRQVSDRAQARRLARGRRRRRRAARAAGRVEQPGRDVLPQLAHADAVPQSRSARG